MVLSEEQKQIIDAEYKLGKTAINIAKIIGVGKGQVFSYLKESNQIRKGGYKKMIDPELEGRVVDLYSTGLTTSQVAKEVDLGQSTIVGILQKYNAARSLSESHRKYSPELKQNAIDMYVRGHSLNAVSKFYDVTHPSSITQWLNDAGIPQRDRSEAAIGSNQHYMRGRTGEDHHLWKGGLSFGPYCPKFNKYFKRRVRAFFKHECALCGKPQSEEQRALQVHHIHYNKSSCCDVEAPREFILLCNSCHMKTNHNRDYWEEYLSDLIKTKYGGKCYYSEKEYVELDNIIVKK